MAKVELGPFHPEVRFEMQPDVAGQWREVIGTIRSPHAHGGRLAVYLTHWSGNGRPMLTVSTGHDTKDYSSRAAAVAWAKRTLADVSLNARWYE